MFALVSCPLGSEVSCKQFLLTWPRCSYTGEVVNTIYSIYAVTLCNQIIWHYTSVFVRITEQLSCCKVLISLAVLNYIIHFICWTTSLCFQWLRYPHSICYILHISKFCTFWRLPLFCWLHHLRRIAPA